MLAVLDNNVECSPWFVIVLLCFACDRSHWVQSGCRQSHKHSSAAMHSRVLSHPLQTGKALCLIGVTSALFDWFWKKHLNIQHLNIQKSTNGYKGNASADLVKSLLWGLLRPSITQDTCLPSTLSPVSHTEWTPPLGVSLWWSVTWTLTLTPRQNWIGGTVARWMKRSSGKSSLSSTTWPPSAGTSLLRWNMQPCFFKNVLSMARRL